MATPEKYFAKYSVNFQYLNKFSCGFWDNQWFGRNQIYFKLKLEASEFMPGIKNLNLIYSPNASLRSAFSWKKIENKIGQKNVTKKNFTEKKIQK
jgi:outer membrane protease